MVASFPPPGSPLTDFSPPNSPGKHASVPVTWPHDTRAKGSVANDADDQADGGIARGGAAERTPTTHGRLVGVRHRGRGSPAGEPLSQVDARWVGQVRRIVTARLRLLGLIRLQDDLLLIVSEVMTNAVTHAGYGGPGSVTFVQRLAGGGSGSRYPTPDAAVPRSRPPARRKRAAGGFTWSTTSPASWAAVGASTRTTAPPGSTSLPRPPPDKRALVPYPSTPSCPCSGER